MAGADKTRQRYARLAGFLYLVILAVFYLGDYFAVSPAIVAGDFARTAHNIAASETLYRLGLAGELAASWLTIPLAGALYVVLRPVDANLALFALLFRVAEAVLGSVCSLLNFAALRVYTAAAGEFGDPRTLVHLLARAYGAGFMITVVFFTAGSVLFFALFFRSRLIPRLLSAFGVLASFAMMAVAFANLIVPRDATVLAPGGIAILAAEVIAGLWLLFAGVNPAYSNTRERSA